LKSFGISERDKVMPELITIPNIDLNTLNGTTKKRETLKVTPDGLKLPSSLENKLPATVRNYLKFSAPLSDVSNEFLLMPFLAICGALIGKKRFMQLGGITIYPVIWTVIFAASSLHRKTTALSIARSVFKVVNENWKNAYEAELREWKKAQKEANEKAEPFDRPEPFKRTLYAPDSTSDLTFYEGLRDNGNQIAMPSEFTGMYKEWTRPRNGLSETVLRIFDAEDNIRRVTRMGGDIELQNPILCIAGATTLPAFQRALTSTERGNGLLQRILPVTLEERTKPFKAMTELPKPNGELYDILSRKMEDVARLDTRPVTMDQDAERLFTNWSHKQHEQAVKLESQINDIGGFISRLNAYGLKFALIFQTLDDPQKPICYKNMDASIELCEWLFKHQVYMLQKNYIFNRFYADRLKIREMLEKHNGAMSRTDLMNLSHYDKEQLDRALANEIESGYVEEIKIETGGRPRLEYRLKEAKDV